MVRVIMKKVPRKTDYNVQHKVIKRWCEAVVATPKKQEIRIISAKELLQKTQAEKGRALKEVEVK